MKKLVQRIHDNGQQRRGLPGGRGLMDRGGWAEPVDSNGEKSVIL